MSDTATMDDHAGQTPIPPLTGLFGFARGAILAYLGATGLFVAACLAGFAAPPDLLTDDYTYSETQGEQMLLLAYGLSSLLYVAVFVVSVVAVSRFTFRAMKTLHRLGEPRAEMTPGWAVGWYFVPFANLFKPLEGMRQIVEGSYVQAGKPLSDAPSLGLWWGTWIVGNLLSNVAWRIDDQTVMLFADIASALVHGVSAVLLLTILRKVREAQDAALSTHVF